MEVIILSEHGYDEACLGFSLSYNATFKRASEILPKYAFGKPGESKFLESIMIWLDVSAPRYFWQEADTYRISSKQSASTMHTLKRAGISQDNFEHDIPDVLLDLINKLIDEGTPLAEIKNILPEGFIQRRIWTMSYKTLQNIYNQRKDHRLDEWHIFLDKVLLNLQHPEFIKPLTE